jgi:type I restriction enzyme S subunit
VTGEWKECKLGEIAAEIKSGGTPSTKHQEYYGGVIPWLNTKEIDFNRIRDTNIKITEDGLNNSSAKWVKENSIIVAMYGATAGKIAINKIPLTTNQACCNITPDSEKIDYNFVYYNLCDRYNELVNLSCGAAQQNLNVGLIKNLDILLPPLPEQRAIASVLSGLDDKIDLLHRQNKTLEAMAETLFRQWFVEEADEGWEEVQLKEVTDISIGRTPPRKESQWFSTNPVDVRWISIKDLGNDGVFIFKTSEYLTQEAVNKFNVPVIPKDTVVLSFKMTVGRVAITTEEMLSNEAIAHFKFNNKTPFTKEYLYLFLKLYQYDSLGSTSSIVTAINSTMIKEMEIIIPDNEKMSDFQDNTELLFNKIRQNQKQIHTLEKMRDTLLPKLMSGEVMVNVNTKI